jgi:NAD(P)-dependent dehydrogenase (short-subunit alcohol dehydrogenase family)
MTDHQGAWDMFAGHPGGTETDMLEGGYSFAALKGTTFMDPQVIADTALNLNSDLAAKVTGVTIPVDAGHLILTPVNPNPTR